jgi:hypothetical protein
MIIAPNRATPELEAARGEEARPIRTDLNSAGIDLMFHMSRFPPYLHSIRSFEKRGAE